MSKCLITNSNERIKTNTYFKLASKSGFGNRFRGSAFLIMLRKRPNAILPSYIYTTNKIGLESSKVACRAAWL